MGPDGLVLFMGLPRREAHPVDWTGSYQMGLDVNSGPILLAHPGGNKSIATPGLRFSKKYYLVKKITKQM